MDKKRFPYKRAIIVSLGYFAATLTWSIYNIYVPIFARNNLLDLLGNASMQFFTIPTSTLHANLITISNPELTLGYPTVINTLVGAIMILDNIAALLIQPYIGELSDRTWIPKLGRRMPFVILGLPLSAFFFGLIGSFETTLYLLLLAIVGFNISMAFFKTPVMSLLPDTLEKEYRSQGTGVLNVLGGVANFVGLFSSSYLYKINHSLAFWVISATMILCLVIMIFNIKEKKEFEAETETISEERVKILKSLKKMFTDTDKTLLLMLFSIFFFNAGYYVAETFLSSYVVVVLGFTEDQAAIILGVFMIFVIISALPAGFLGRKIGPINAILVGLGGFIIGLIPISIISITSLGTMSELLTLNSLQFGGKFILYFFIVLMMGFCYTLATINKIVVIWNMAPDRKIATFTGYFYVFTALAAIVSPFLAGVTFDFVSKISGKTGLKSLFLYVLVAFLISITLVSILKWIQTKNLQKDKEKIEELRKERRERRKSILLLPTLIFGQGVKRQQVRDLRKLQKQEIKDIREDFRLTTDRTKETRKEFAEKRKHTRKKHRKEIQEAKENN
jgi:MFS family permease